MDPDSLEEKPSSGVESLDVAAGAAVIDVSGGPVSMAKSSAAGV